MMDLRHLVDGVLFQDTKKLAYREREIMSQVLHHLREIDRRKLFAELGFSSMFTYCTDELKYSHDQAQRRISACRMLAELPEIEKKLDEGVLNLTVLGMANSFFKEYNLDTEEKLDVLEKIEGKSKKEVEIILAPEKSHAPAKGTTRKVSKTQTKVTLVLDDSVVEKLKELQALLSHSKKRELPELIAITVLRHTDRLCSQELEKRKKSLKTTRASQGKSQITVSGQAAKDCGTKVVGRSVSSKIRKEVWVKAKGKCQHPLCASKHFLQLHHVVPFSHGGKHEVSNLQLLCHAHHARGHIISG